MKKIISMLLAVLMLASFCGTALAEESKTVSYDDIGLSFQYPAQFDDLEGILEVDPYGAIDYNPATYALLIEYIALTQDEYDEVNERFRADKLSAEEIDFYRTKRSAVLGAYIATKGDEASAAENLENLMKISETVRLGSADGFNFYYLKADTADFADGLDAEFAGELVLVDKLLDEAFRNAKVYKPHDPLLEMVGKKLTFTAVDLDGNTHTSEELFSANKYTMVNIWGTWCINCLNEMGELAELHKKMQAKGCGLLGIEWEYDDEAETLAQARDILAKYDITYPNVLAHDDMAFMDDVMGFPTSIFVDSDGVIVAPPILGAVTELYEPTFEMLLNADSDQEEEEAPAANVKKATI